MAASRYAHLSAPDPAWLSVAEKHAPLDALAAEVYRLPLAEFRKVPYRPSPLPSNVPQPDTDITIRTDSATARDGASIGLRIYAPVGEAKEKRPLFYNIHGGGWAVGTTETEEAQNRFVAARNGAVVVSVDYRLAPEHPFPTAIHDSMDGLQWCLEHASELGVDTDRIVLGGGSAGANIVAAMTLLLRDDAPLKGQFIVIGQVLNIPVTCHPSHSPSAKYELLSYEQNKHVPLVDAERMHIYWNHYIPAAEAGSLLASPLLASSLANLPPALVQVAGMDPLRDGGLAYAEALKSAGVATTLKIYPGMPHAFYVYPDLEPSQQYFDTVVEWIASLGRNKVQGEETHIINF
ncbi:hypothetical protein SCUCBS95973_008136 [Sporothrix curviconia]|uniref:Alpha/beta hydrolase fold-3 domain-containing protein n=1 Tax=Sporothrix curviconia TaxID=1260050 RepID=A0ABP0CKX9_9PEZI